MQPRFRLIEHPCPRFDDVMRSRRSSRGDEPDPVPCRGFASHGAARTAFAQ